LLTGIRSPGKNYASIQPIVQIGLGKLLNGTRDFEVIAEVDFVQHGQSCAGTISLFFFWS
jgi:hypothetical protein